MSTAISFTPAITTPRRSDSLSFNLSAIFRSQGFKLAAEALTLISLITASAIWLLAL